VFLSSAVRSSNDLAMLSGGFCLGVLLGKVVFSFLEVLDGSDLACAM